jgi:hypothetical protein
MSMSLLLARLLAAPLAFVCMRSKLLVLLSRLVNSVNPRPLALDDDCRFSAEVRWTAEGEPGVKLNPVPSSDSLGASRGVDDANMLARCGWLWVRCVIPGRFRLFEYPV